MRKLVPINTTLIPDSAKKVFAGQIFDVYQWPQKMFDGSEHTFEMLKRPDTVIVIGIVEGKIMVIDDEQPHHGMRVGFPGGRVDPTDNSVEDAARREVIEETGYHFNHFKIIDVIRPVHKMEWFIYTFVAWEVSDVTKPTPDSGEKITLRFQTFDEVKDMILHKKDTLDETQSIFKNVKNSDDLLTLPAFVGQEVDR